ncbi:MAG: glycoside hydrolase family 5 protein [Bacteroidota bacterium]
MFRVISLLVVLTIFIQCKSSHPGIDNQDQDPVSKHGQLAISGKHLTDQNGVPVQLKGMSLFWSQWMPQYFNKTTVKQLKEHWNCNVVRAPLAVERGGYLENPEREQAKVITVIEAAIQEGIYVIIDWHDHHAEDHVEESITFFSHIAEKYGSYPNIIYEIYNEPLNVSWSTVLKPYHQRVIAAIRTYDKNNVIVCGTPTWSQRVDEAALDPIKAKNIAYSLHFYAGTHKEELREKTISALDRNLPIIVTEYGTTDADGDGNVDTEETQRWWDFLDAHHISYCNWSVADKQESSSVLLPGTRSEEIHLDQKLTPSGKFVRAKLKAQ